MYMYTHTHTHTHMYMDMYVYIYTYTPYTYMDMYVYIYTYTPYTRSQTRQPLIFHTLSVTSPRLIFLTLGSKMIFSGAKFPKHESLLNFLLTPPPTHTPPRLTPPTGLCCVVRQAPRTAKKQVKQ